MAPAITGALLLLVAPTVHAHGTDRRVTHQSEEGKELPSFLMILGDDIGWADFSWNNGTANTPHMAAWAKRAGSILMQDSHSGGTVCSPTRASVLTGRTPLRDCINGVYGCSDMTECVPHFEFAPQSSV